jgi:phage gpG-like protein
MSRIYDLKFLGDIAKLNKLGKDIGKAGAVVFLERLSAKLGKEALSLIDEGFQRGIAPNGKPWPRPRKAHRALIESGALRGSFSADTNEYRASIESSAPYAVFIQRGTRGENGKRGIGPRKMLPEGVLPLRWKNRMEAVFMAHLRSALGGSR